MDMMAVDLCKKNCMLLPTLSQRKKSLVCQRRTSKYLLKRKKKATLRVLRQVCKKKSIFL